MKRKNFVMAFLLSGICKKLPVADAVGIRICNAVKINMKHKNMTSLYGGSLSLLKV